MGIEGDRCCAHDEEPRCAERGCVPVETHTDDPCAHCGALTWETAKNACTRELCPAASRLRMLEAEHTG